MRVEKKTLTQTLASQLSSTLILARGTFQRDWDAFWNAGETQSRSIPNAVAFYIVSKHCVYYLLLLLFGFCVRGRSSLAEPRSDDIDLPRGFVLDPDRVRLRLITSNNYVQLTTNMYIYFFCG